MKTAKKRIAIFIMLCLCLGYNSNAQGQRKDKFMIGIFWPPVWEQTNLEQYRAIRDANVDYIQNVLGNHLNTEERNIKMLQLAEQCGLKMYVADPRVKGSEEDIGAMIDTYKKYKATIGYYILDEPDIAGLTDAAMRYKAILKYAPDAIPYVNLFPTYAPLGASYAENYVDKWIELCGKENLKYLSFDNYPFIADGTFRDDGYFQNLDIIRIAGLKNSVKTSCYGQSVGIPHAYRRPNAVELRYSAFSCIAYGIKNLVWFTYWTPTDRGSEQFTDAIIDPEGNKTDLYIPFAALNGELRQLGKTLVQLDAREVYHSGNIPAGAKIVPEDFIISPEDKTANLILTLFLYPKTGQEYVMAVNKSFTETKQLQFTVSPKYKRVKEISSLTGKLVTVKKQEDKISVILSPGHGKLFLCK